MASPQRISGFFTLRPRGVPSSCARRRLLPRRIEHDDGARLLGFVGSRFAPFQQRIHPKRRPSDIFVRAFPRGEFVRGRATGEGAKQVAVGPSARRELPWFNLRGSVCRGPVRIDLVATIATTTPRDSRSTVPRAWRRLRLTRRSDVNPNVTVDPVAPLPAGQTSPIVNRARWFGRNRP